MRLGSVLGIACLVFAASAANAVTFEILETFGGDPDMLGIGETVTISVVVTLDPGDNINGLGASFYDWDDTVLSFTSGQAVDELFYQTPALREPTDPLCASVPSLCVPADGIGNIRGGALAEGVVIGGDFDGVPEVEIIVAVSATDFFSDQGIEDIGLDGNLGTSQFDLVFTGAADGTTDIIIGGGADLGGVIAGTGSFINTGITITVPEAAASAMSLAGLGVMAAIVLLRRRSM